ncbi:DEAD/DEAH box helicase protein [Rhodospirillum centenum SW]|uniref:DEAD/DEAH box helicase protein n=1 Tax=Rhodospirillum centenum (strain ATCC 51521 / SW) TaxID=414684 RepID=B6IS62_RHOCS|nr:DEAD/DEAH box helicase protein [Rhodospirillum centenum SW]
MVDVTGSVSFSDLGLLPHLLKAVEELGFTTPTPIQQQALPAALTGRDVVASANTGTGKTAAFVLPSLQRIATTARAEAAWGPRVLVLTPTRELASQVLESVRNLSKFGRIQTGTILGGMPYRQQLEMLRRRVDLIVATPGRLMDHMERGRLDLSGVEVLVLDEADRMLDMGFREAVEFIAAACPAERQTLLFTATLDRTAERLAQTLTRDPVRIDVAGKAVVTAQVEQRWLRADGLEHKHRLLETLLGGEEFGKGIVFIATKLDADRLADTLSEKGHKAMPLHGDMQQRDRNRVVQWLRDGRINVIVATDVAARGIDIADLTHVINFDLPKQAEDYVHRIGRTGRAGASGVSYSLFTRMEWRQVRAIEAYTNKAADMHVLPGLEPMPEPERRPGGFNKGRPGGGKPGFKGRGFGGGNGGGGGYRGNRPWGERRDGERSFGDRPFGDRPQGDRPHGDRPHADRPHGERSFGDRPHGDRPQGERFRNDRPRGDRPHGEHRPHGERGHSERPARSFRQDAGSAPMSRRRPA